MKRYELDVEGFHTPLSAEQIRELFQAGRLRRSDRCRETGTREWRTIDELFPLLKYDSSAGSSWAPPKSSPRISSAFDGSDEPGDVKRPTSSALKAGWICFGLGLAIAWWFPLGHAFFSVALITAVVAMCTHQVNRGLALLVSSFVAIGLCTLVFFTLVLGTVGVVAGAAVKHAHDQVEQQKAQQRRAVGQLTAVNHQAQTQSVAPTAAPAPRPAFPSLKEAGNAIDRHRQHELAMAQQRQVDAQKAADQRQRDQNVWKAERQRDLTRAKEQRLQQLQNSIEWNDRMIRQANEHNVNPKVFKDQRDSLLKEKAKLQGY